MFRILFGTIVFVITFLEPALADNGRCSDTKGKWDTSHLEIGPNNFVPASSRYWIVPLSNKGPQGSLEVERTIKNLMSRYIRINQPTFTCPNDTTCTSPRVSGSFLFHSGHWLSKQFYSGFHSSVNVHVPGRSGEIMDIRISPLANGYTDSQCLKGKGIFYQLYSVRTVDTKEKLPYLLFQEASYPLRYTPDLEYRGL